MLCDANVWLALTLSGHVHHDATRTWLDTVDEPGSVAFCRPTQQALLRLLTTAAVLRPYGNEPLTNVQAWQVYDALATDDRIVLRVGEPPGVDPVWRSLTDHSASSPKLWMDAYLAAYAICAGHTLVTTDRGFTRVADLDLLLLS